jgi:KDO2-lipid IV(A) lauroyltransferase
MDKTVQNKMKPWKILYWQAWIALGILWILIKLPPSLRIKIGKTLGKLAFLLPTQTKYTTEVNLRLCFPHLNAAERKTLLKKNFISLGIALIESAMAWLASKKQLQSLYTLHGYDHIRQAFQQGKGILLVTPHFTCVELVARFIGLEENFGILYRQHKKPWLASIQTYFRKRHFKYGIPSDQIKNLLRALRQNKAIWYAHDIDESGKRSVFAPFFGIPTASLTTVTDIARLSGAAVIPMQYFRRDDNMSYEIHFLQPLENFPSGEKLNDAIQLNSILESMIREKPEQYVWQYKRFKTRPHGEKRFYSRSLNRRR